MHEWETNNVRSRATYADPKRKNRSGEHLTSWFAHAMRCSCGSFKLFCIFGLNCCLAGRSVALRARTFHTQATRCRFGLSNSFAFLD